MRCYAVAGSSLPTHTAPSGHYNEEIIRGVRNLLLQAYGEANRHESARRIYISRGRARMRKLVNEQAVIDLLRPAGFQIVHMQAEDLSLRAAGAPLFRCSLRDFESWRRVTNMLFMPAGGQRARTAPPNRRNQQLLLHHGHARWVLTTFIKHVNLSTLDRIPTTQIYLSMRISSNRTCKYSFGHSLVFILGISLFHAAQRFKFCQWISFASLTSGAFTPRNRRHTCCTEPVTRLAS